MKLLKITLLVLVSIVVIVFLYVFISFKTYSPGDGDTTVDTQLLKYYNNSYVEAKQDFELKAKELSKKYINVQTGAFRVESETDTGLYVNYCYIPAQVKNDKLMILTSGTHGVEGYTGSAVQLMIADRLMAEDSLGDMGVLFIHSLNPFGFKYCRKSTENNVDLNRNCMITKEQFNTNNEGFTMLYNLLTPSGEVNLMELKNQLFPFVAIGKIIKYGMPVLRQAALQGQYDYCEGIYYGGEMYEPQIDSIRPILQSVINQYPITLNIDLHTGYGTRGNMHLFIDPVDDSLVMNGIETIFAGEKIDWGSGDDFYAINGSYVEMVSSLSDSSLIIPMLFEFGTLNSSTTFGSLKSISTMILENQGFNNGYKTDAAKTKVKLDMMELYCPVSEAWRSETLRSADAMFTKVFERL